MTTWFTSDHHFGHKNIIEYCSRPFADVAEMNEALVCAWNDCVASTDVVYYLGDFSLKPALMEQFAPRLNGRKILVAGNHDSCHPSNHGGTFKNVGLYKKYFEEVVDELQWSDFLLHHIPYYDDEDERFPEFRPLNEGKILLHGHVHQRWLTNGRQINVGVDVWDYAPVSEEQIRELATKIDAELSQYTDQHT
ncbi:MAG: metallophosphoesterase [Candidatus Obscuribacterales bacterium]|nr:metallophosphoesterase [Candidatus Obscuribacterales bacterium]